MTYSHALPVKHHNDKGVSLFFLAAMSLLLSTSALAASPSQAVEIQFQHDKDFCNSGQSNQDRPTCLREAGAAYQAAREGMLNSGQSDSQLSTNALARCKALPPQDQADCRRRIVNPTELNGSVGSGGILRKDVTTIPAATN